jgi:regulator of sigma E protease
MSYLLAFLGFALLILLHEAGHFLAAKAVGMRVERFSLFFGRMFVKRQFGETEYGIGVVPLGGYVKITGMSPNEEFETPEIEARAYINQAPWKRIVVIAAGPAVNIVIAFLLFWVLFASSNHYVTTPQGNEIATSTVGLVQRGSPAAGLIRLGDRIVSVDGARSGSRQIHAQINKHRCADGARVNGCHAATAATVVVSRAHRLVTLRVRPRWDAAAKEMLLGIGFDAKMAPNGVISAAGQSASWMWHVTERTVSVIAQLFKSKDRKQLHSVVGSYAIATQQISLGWMNGVQIFALVSLALGLVNLFPFLPLDGGHIFWALAEKIRGRRVPIQVIERASLVGIGLIAILFVIGLSNDISTLTGNGFHTQ